MEGSAVVGMGDGEGDFVWSAAMHPREEKHISPVRGKGIDLNPHREGSGRRDFRRLSRAVFRAEEHRERSVFAGDAGLPSRRRVRSPQSRRAPPSVQKRFHRPTRTSPLGPGNPPLGEQAENHAVPVPPKKRRVAGSARIKPFSLGGARKNGK